MKYKNEATALIKSSNLLVQGSFRASNPRACVSPLTFSKEDMPKKRGLGLD